jgi:hypothetical protein
MHFVVKAYARCWNVIRPCPTSFVFLWVFFNVIWVILKCKKPCINFVVKAHARWRNVIWPFATSLIFLRFFVLCKWFQNLKISHKFCWESKSSMLYDFSCIFYKFVFWRIWCCIGDSKFWRTLILHTWFLFLFLFKWLVIIV